MPKEEKDIDPIKAVKDSFYKYIGTFCGLMIIGAITFYFNTQAELAELKDANGRNTARIDKMVSKEEVAEFKATVREEMRSLHDDLKEVRDDNKKILEILSRR